MEELVALSCCAPQAALPLYRVSSAACTAAAAASAARSSPSCVKFEEGLRQGLDDAGRVQILHRHGIAVMHHSRVPGSGNRGRTRCSPASTQMAMLRGMLHSSHTRCGA